MFFSILKASIFGAKESKFLAFLTIFLSVGLIACMLNITLKIGDKLASELGRYGANIVVLPRSANLNIEIAGRDFSPLANDDFLSESDLVKIKEIFWRNNITSYAPFLSEQIDEFEVVGTYFDRPAGVSDEPDFRVGVRHLYPFWRVSGEWAKDGADDEVIAGEKLGLKIGDEIDLGIYTVRVVGILHDAEEYSGKIIANLGFVQKLTHREGQIAKAEVSAMTIPEDDLSVKARRNLDSLDAVEHDTWYCSAYVSSIAYQIAEDFPNASAKAVLSVSEAQSGITKKIQGLMGVVSILSLIISSICIASLLSNETFKRKKEIGLLKALGASGLAIYLQFIAETLVVCLFASILGASAGYLASQIIAQQIFGSFLGFALLVLPLSIAFGFVICLIGSVLPLRSALKLPPAEVLYGRK
ncbi:ABC transporter permease [Campylobacter sp. JMF_08 NE1]|uniref:ABC transporter permease n=1 Tax=Campylobacter sp. JMF_08 NE1 TaxID=2983821 RepID=UPI0022EA0019|nr:ABC transporter permease [Campylobacter sp. JMF_08 NE1]MDA3048033.1 ABC transporter permease [Campylobacter sp. JMF_08 NE1]